jgi:hypothetical protein
MPYNESFPANGNWSIYSVQRTLPVLGQIGAVLGAHDYLVLVDPNGNPVEEMQGVYTNNFTVNGPVAGNYLQVQIWQPNQYMADQSITSSKLVLSGTQADVTDAFQQAYISVAIDLDANHELYDGAELFGTAVNSNSVWYTALLEMGIANPDYSRGLADVA